MSFDKAVNWIFLVPVGFFVGIATGGITQLFLESPLVAVVVAVVVLVGLAIFLAVNHFFDWLFFGAMGAVFRKFDKDSVPDNFGKMDGGAWHPIVVAAIGFLIGIGATLIWTPSQIMSWF